MSETPLSKNAGLQLIQKLNNLCPAWGEICCCLIFCAMSLAPMGYPPRILIKKMGNSFGSMRNKYLEMIENGLLKMELSGEFAIKSDRIIKPNIEGINVLRQIWIP